MALDPQFDGSLLPETESGWELFNSVTEKLDEMRKRKIKSKELSDIRQLQAQVIANVVVHYLAGECGNGVRVTKAKSDLGKKGHRYAPFVFPRSFPKLVDDLCSIGFLKQSVGSYSGAKWLSKRTTIRAGDALIHLINEQGITRADMTTGGLHDEVIILRRASAGYGDAGERVAYEDNEVTTGYRENLRDINKWLASADVAFNAGVYKAPVNAADRQLRRHFSNGSFKKGGRLFGGFWQPLPKEVRRAGIRIEGEAVVGVDYSSINAALVYWQAGAQPPQGDAYTLPSLESYRPGVKAIFNGMLFSDVKRFPKGFRKDYAFPSKVRIGEVTAAIRSKHPALSPFLSGGGIGHTLQFYESEILLRALNACRQEGIIALPIHDCLVVKQSTCERVKKIMRGEFKNYTGYQIGVGIE